MKNINLGQSMTILANVGVVAGILFLAIELQQNNEVLEAEVRATWVNRQAGLLETMALNPDLLSVLLAGREDPDSLSALNFQRVRAIGMRTFVAWEHQFDEMQRGRLDETTIIQMQRSVFHVNKNDYGTRLVWHGYLRDRATQPFGAWFRSKIVDDPYEIP
jgi:hypothetical protein